MIIGTQLQAAIFEALTAFPAIAGGRVYDDVPPEDDRVAETGAADPYVTIGDDQVLDDGNSCDDGWEIFADVDIWSRAVGYDEVKSIGVEVVERVRSITSIAGFQVIAASLSRYQPMRDPDGITRRLAITFRFLLNPA
ncbi:DUF3168 domain-containing protein [Chelativorans sp.]|uniref:DUF3168 domain-containing protein n=1 Tax=Chelativorans sp. TaxID=2203393 RepID=UPI0028125999|nr:DUF3168 domain-containing protein [Chelativorans sp.]